ncbi:hypothetical protein G3N59_07925 [Paraburkholderia sp. Ac-20340]|uniref:hypothetical protein n=1 Tax=Paraburkholderia sp. Ac-20340 TaxID=2703888 RepID=UPI0019821AAB|nr:hypothetical protein [Paraburkholderia sp. Ac-20340]MBN3853300.1 hypothetical protein [Paraburkholderia sp. Ac-20340]
MSTQSEQSGVSVVPETISNAQKTALFSMIDEAMNIMEGDKKYSQDDVALGAIHNVKSWPSDPGKTYVYRSNSIPSAAIEFSTMSDPSNYSDDRNLVPIVPKAFSIYFRDSVSGVDREELERRLSLGNFWIDIDGNRHDGNSLQPSPPSIQLRVYRYRVKSERSSPVPVDVELSFFDAKEGDEHTAPVLNSIEFRRAYPYLTPAMRKQKRDEAAARANAAYGKSRGGEQ